MNTTTILQTVCYRMNVSIEDIRGPVRSRKLAEARKVFAYVCRKLTRTPFHLIGKEVNKDHSSIIYGVRTCEILMSAYKDFDFTVNQILSDLSTEYKGEEVKLKIQETV